MNKFYPSSKSNTVSSLKLSKTIRLLLMVLFFSIIHVNAFGQNSQTFTATGTFVVPVGVTSLTVEVWGAGGAGGASDDDEDGGGGGGAYAVGVVTVIPGVSYPYTVGLGGTSNGNNSGTNGGDSFFDTAALTVVRAGGGKTIIIPGNNNGGPGGLVINGSGFNGGQGGAAGGYSGGGGGGVAGPLGQGGQGGPGTTSNGGYGGAGQGNIGNGGAGATVSTMSNGVNGSPPGGGGGGDNNNGGSSSSGAGGNGQIRITWTEITQQPQPQIICAGQNGSFTVATSASIASYLWQYSVDGSTSWTTANVANVTAGYTTALLSLTATPIAYNGYYFRCIVTSEGRSTISTKVVLIVKATPSAPTAGITSQPTCSTATGSVVLSGLPTGNWILTRNPGNITTTGSGTSTTISGLPAGTYAYSVIGLNKGLKGEYFNNKTLSGTPALTRIDSTVDFPWAGASPDPLINTDNFSVRWSGLIQPLYNETYTFTTSSDDGIRLWVNGKQIINNWTDHGTTTNTGTIALTAGVKYDIILEFYENGGGAVSQLSWSHTTNSTSVIIPQSQLYPDASCSSPYSANVVINAQPATPATPATITQPTNKCANSTGNVFSIGAVTGATSYTWSVAGTGWSVIAGGSTTSATITIGSGVGTVSVTATNACGTSSASTTGNITPITAPATPGTITQPTNKCANSTGNVFSIGAVAGATSYTWSVAGTGWSVTAGGSTISATITIGSGVGTVSVTATNACVTSSASTTGNITPTTAPAGLSYTVSSISYCQGAVVTTNSPSLTTIGSPTATYSVSPALPAGLSLNTSTGAITGTPTIAVAATNYTVTASNSCGNATTVLNITVNPLPTAPTVGTITDYKCDVATGSVVLTGLPSGNYTINPGNIIGNTAMKTIGGLTAATYNFTVTNASGCVSSPSANVVIKPVLTNTWNGLVWSILPTPTIDQNIVFDGSFSSIADLTGCSCVVKAGINVTINPLHTLKLTNGLTVEDAGIPKGTLTFENTASLVQINEDPSINSGNITYKRNTKPVKRYDYTYWSSPVASQTLYDLSPNTLYDKYYGYNPDAGWELYYNGAHTMGVGKGYIIRAPQSFSITTPQVDTAPQFMGEPNNGLKTVDVIAGQYYLLGNPYPSALDAEEFLKVNSLTSGVLDGSIYFWTHNSPPSKAVVGDAIYNYTSNDYACYNLTGSVKTAAILDLDPNDPNNNNNFSLPSGKIAAGQAFFATSKANGTVTFKNSMRVGVGIITGTNDQFFKMNKSRKTTSTIARNRVWLNLTNTQGAFKQTLVGYVTGATNDYDSAFDGESFDGNEYVDFYSVNQDRNFVIQGRALPFEENDEVPLGYRTTINGEFTINIDQMDGVLTNQAVFIEDKLANTVFDLKKGNYTFSTAPGTFNDRFVLKYSNKTLSVDITEKNDGILAFYSNNYNTLIIHNNSLDTTVNSVSLFNMTGQKIGVWDVRNSAQTNIQIPLKKISSGIYIVKAKTNIGESSKKIIVN